MMEVTSDIIHLHLNRVGASRMDEHNIRNLAFTMLTRDIYSKFNL